MKFYLGFLVVVLFSFCLAAGQSVENSDKPERGNWDFKAEPVWEIDSAGGNVLVNVTSVAVGDDHSVYLMDRKHEKIFVLDKNGKFKRTIGKKGEGPGEYKMLFHFILMDNTIIVPDMGVFHYFNTDGSYVESIKPGLSFIFPMVMLDKYRFLYEKSSDEKDKKRDTLTLFDLKKNKGTELLNTVYVKPSTASSGNMRLSIKMDGNIAAYDGKDFYFGKGSDYQIKKMDLTGKVLMTFSLTGRKKIRVTDAMKRKKYEKIVFNGGKMPKKMVDQLIRNEPDFAPYFNRFRINGGLLFVSLVEPTNNSAKTYDIFSKSGKYLYRAKFNLPEGYILMNRPVFKGNFVYVFVEDDEGEGKLIKFRIRMPAA